MPKMTGARALTKTIMGYGVDTIFGVPGVQLDPLFDAFYHEKDKLRVIHTRHEQGAAYMALGYALSTGREGVCTVVPGPGVLNAAAGVLTAHGLNAKVLCVGGQVRSGAIDKPIGLLHEIHDQKGVMASVTKWQARADTPAEAPGVIAEAFRQMNTGRNRPVFVEMAPDIMAAEDDIAIPAADTNYPVMEPDPDLVEQAAALLGNADNPAIFVGGGIWGAEEELLRLAEAVQAPVFMSEQGLGAVDWRHPLAQNMVAAAHAWPKIDVAVAVGTRFLLPAGFWGRDDDIKLIRIDPDAQQSVGVWPPDVHLIAHGKPALGAIAERVGRHNRKREPVADEMAALKSAAVKEVAETLPGQNALGRAIRAALPEDGLACFGVTQMGFWGRWNFEAYHPRSIVQPGYQGTLGYSFPTALGAQVAHPDKKVVCVTGDGGFMFGASELATAMLHGINLVTVVMNNNAYGNVRKNQMVDFDGRVISAELHNPDFVKYAESFGALGLRATTPDELRAALEKAFAADRPAIVDVPFEGLEDWRVLEHRARMRG